MLSYPTIVENTAECYNSTFPPVSTDSTMTFPGAVISGASTKSNEYFTKPPNKVDYLNNNATIDTNSSISSTTSDHAADNNFLLHKGGENSKRFSVNNLLQLASCSGSKLGGEFDCFYS
jgi:hypothetical protein